jgi:hypothetical protein
MGLELTLFSTKTAKDKYFAGLTTFKWSARGALKHPYYCPIYSSTVCINERVGEISVSYKEFTASGTTVRPTTH